MKTLGLCLGASNISMVALEKISGEIRISDAVSKPHDGNAQAALLALLSSHRLADFDQAAVTGRKFKDLVNFTPISEPEAVENAYAFLQGRDGDFDTVVSAGGEMFIVYSLNKKGRIIDVVTGNKCASGTGEFFLQQLKRMQLSMADAMSIAENPPYQVAGRCSVFCKSDSTHAMNKGEPKGRIVSGLCKMMAVKILELLKKNRAEKVLLIGGTAKNKQMLHFLKQELPKIQVPAEAAYYEALGAALWALDHQTARILDPEQIFNHEQHSFSFLPALADYLPQVTFKSQIGESAPENTPCLVGLDVGSTTTKAVLIKNDNNAIVASVYLRTNGDPIAAARQCYQQLLEQLPAAVRIIGLGVTGSGRQIAGLHAMTGGVINEIIAHAAAAVYFDPDVDTIFEIGGQDAKYTYLTNGVATDYAMNEACSAGTGSFLEEAAMETMGIPVLEIEKIALASQHPPNFNDQCAAFISSDIKTAVQEGISREDITAGLVYSICQNYANRVKGNRPVGRTVFMQGGVCYNQAVPAAMAALTGRKIVVPPEPGLMGAFGVALVVKEKLALGLLPEDIFNLQTLAERQVAYGQPMICSGGKEKCDRKCQISTIIIDGKKYPFGGACNRFVNRLNHLEFDVASLDLVHLREKMIFEEFVRTPADPGSQKTVGISRSLLTNSLYPLYYNFFIGLGLKVVLTDYADPQGMANKNAAFCYPVELAHGYIHDLLQKETDYIFLPQVREMFVENGLDTSVTCPFVQGEPYFLKTTFPELKIRRLLTPVLDFSRGYDGAADVFIKLGQELGVPAQRCQQAYRAACAAITSCYQKMQQIGAEVLAQLAEDPQKIAVVLFGRSYNALTKTANMGIPHKFASRGVTILPLDFLPFAGETAMPQMYWSTGQIILQAARLAERNPQLFAAYITNFSCGPDSFIISYFRSIMGQKPSLTLELDSHTADAGVDTRIEAFLDVIISYREMQKRSQPVQPAAADFQIARTAFTAGRMQVIDSAGFARPLNDPAVHILVPSMGDIGAQCIAAAFRYAGINASHLQPPGEIQLKAGRANSACKECLPLTLTLGALLEYLEQRPSPDELLVYFMPAASGPCRFGQYNVLMQNFLQKSRIKDVALISLSSTNKYAGLGLRFQLRAWAGVLISDALDDIYSGILVLAKDPQSALIIYHQQTAKIVQAFATENWRGLRSVLTAAAKKMAAIPRSGAIADAKKVGLLGEIYVRRDDFSRQHLIERMAAKNIVVKAAPVAEWIYYCDYLLKKSLLPGKNNAPGKISATAGSLFKRHYEKQVKAIFNRSGFYDSAILETEQMVAKVAHLISPKLTGEAILTVGAALTEIIDQVSGIIAIGPFGCMPNRIAEALITEAINLEKQGITEIPEIVARILEDHPAMPFLAIESDGNIFPQVIEARLEAFYLQVERLHHTIREVTTHN